MLLGRNCCSDYSSLCGPRLASSPLPPLCLLEVMRMRQSWIELPSGGVGGSSCCYFQSLGTSGNLTVNCNEPGPQLRRFSLPHMELVYVLRLLLCLRVNMRVRPGVGRWVAGWLVACVCVWVCALCGFCICTCLCVCVCFNPTSACVVICV